MNAQNGPVPTRRPTTPRPERPIKAANAYHDSGWRFRRTDPHKDGSPREHEPWSHVPLLLDVRNATHEINRLEPTAEFEVQRYEREAAMFVYAGRMIDGHMHGRLRP